MHVCAYWADRFAGCIEIEFISSGADPSVGVDHRRSPAAGNGALSKAHPRAAGRRARLWNEADREPWS